MSALKKWYWVCHFAFITAVSIGVGLRHEELLPLCVLTGACGVFGVVVFARAKVGPGPDTEGTAP